MSIDRHFNTDWPDLTKFGASFRIEFSSHVETDSPYRAGLGDVG